MNSTVQITTSTFLVDDTSVARLRIYIFNSKRSICFICWDHFKKYISTNAVIHETLDLETRWLSEIHITFQLTDIKYPKHSSSSKKKVINKGKTINLVTSLVHILPLVAVFLEHYHPLYSHTVLCTARFICFLHVLPFTQCTFSAKRSVFLSMFCRRMSFNPSVNEV